jgi:hypothetical protein
MNVESVSRILITEAVMVAPLIKDEAILEIAKGQTEEEKGRFRT